MLCSLVFLVLVLGGGGEESFFAGQHGVEDHGHHESHGDAVRGKDLAEQGRELREDVAHLREAQYVYRP